MRKSLFLLLLPSFLFAQYWGERVTEKSFENSDLYFNSHYLNTFGIYHFRDVSAGLLDDPFLRLQINPALFPEKEELNTQFYLDFRGDRTEAEVIQYPIYPPYYDYVSSSSIYRPIDPRWYAITRSEPEPVFSLGVLAHPLNDRLFLGATYQMLYRQEPYYQTPTGIYNSRYGYGANGDKLVADESVVPVIDRYSGADEMMTSGHLFSGFAGYKISEKINLGLNLNGIVHNREGQYANLNADQYATTAESDWFNSYSTERNQDYSHIDISAGIAYQLNEKLRLGLKAGALQGDATQKLFTNDSSVYDYNFNNNSEDNWSHSYRVGSTDQKWTREGNAKYGTINLDYKIAEKSTVSFYYNYNATNIDLASRSAIEDTSFYAGEWTSTYGHSIHESDYIFSDRRTSAGTNDRTKQEAMLSVRWQETERTTVFFGLFIQSLENTIDTREPVIAKNRSEYTNSHEYFEDNTQYDYNYLYSLNEIKNLVWDYKSSRNSIQIPVLINFRINPSWDVMLGINRMWDYWEITDQTTAYFTRRTKNENGTIKDEQNFGERYTQPVQKFTDNTTAFVAGMGLQITPKLKINVLVDPENDPDWRIAQWWLSFRATL